MAAPPASRRDNSVRPPRIAVLCGTDGASQIEWDTEKPVAITGNNDIYRLIDQTRFHWRRAHLTPGYFAQDRRWQLERCHLAFNIVSEPDANPRTLQVVEQVVSQLGRPIVNRPAAVRQTVREAVAQRLRGIPGAIVPRVIRLRHPTAGHLKFFIQSGQIAFPAIVRPTGTHTGKVVGLFETPEDCEAAIADMDRDYVVIEFVETRRADGLYPKIRFFFIGDAILVRHLFLGSRWNVHGSDYEEIVMGNLELEAEEERLLRGGFDALPSATREALRAIRQRIGLDFFGLDAAILPDGRLVVFEANATMNFFPLSYAGRGLYKHEVCLPPAQEAMTRLLLGKLGRAA